MDWNWLSNIDFDISRLHGEILIFFYFSYNLISSPAHPTFLEQDGRQWFLICIVATMVQQCNLRTRGGHLSSKMRDELRLGHYL
jgi:hypothetical protein